MGINKKVKIFFAVIVALFCLLFFLLKDEKGQDEIYLVPEGYQGAVYIIFDQKNGAQKKYEDKKRVYEIPEDGILKTQFDINKGWHNPPVCYYVSNNKRSRVPFYLIGKDIKGGDTIQACCSSAGVFYLDDKNIPTDYDIFFIGTERAIDSAFEMRAKINLSKLIN